MRPLVKREAEKTDLVGFEGGARGRHLVILYCPLKFGRILLLGW